MNETVNYFQLQTDRSAVEYLKAQLINFAASNPDDVERLGDQFLFSNTLKVHFLNFPEDMMEELDAVGIAIMEPHQLKVIQPFLDALRAPIQMSSRIGGDVIIIPAAAVDEFGPADTSGGTYSVGQLIALDQKSFLTVFSAGFMGEDDGRPSVIYNKNYDIGHDITLPTKLSDDEIVRGQYEYIITPTNVSLDGVFFRILGLQHYTAYDDGETATYQDEARSVRISAYKVEYQDGKFWTLSIFIPDQGTIREATLTNQILRHAVAESRGWRIFAVISADDLGEITTAQEYILHMGDIREGQFRNFVMD